MGCMDELGVWREPEPHSTGLKEAVTRSKRCPWASPSM